MLRSWIEINLDHVSHNIKELRKFVDSHVSIMAVVKAEGYGHGAAEVSKVLIKNGADALGVATCDEGISLRKSGINSGINSGIDSGINSDILIMAHSPAQRYEEIISHNLKQTVSSLQMAKEISKAAQKLQKTASLHIKIDTGMSRIGFKPTSQTIEDIMEISHLPFISIDGVFSHLAMSETSDTSFSYEQSKKYQYITDSLKQKGLANFKMHLCNSGGILNNTDLHFDMIRPGAILYGLYPTPETNKALNLKPVMSLKSRISHLSDIEPGESVGYDRTFFAKRKTRVATIIIGYADGYPSSLSNKGKVIVGSGYAPIIGQICMDQMMIDVTDIKNVQENDEVILLGKKGDLEITAEHIMSLVKIKIREISCIIGKRVPRVYISEDNPKKIINL